MNKHVPAPERIEPLEVARAEVLRKAELARQRLFAPLSDEDRALSIAQARARAASGQFIPLAEVVAWVESWGTDNELPTPMCK